MVIVMMLTLVLHDGHDGAYARDRGHDRDFVHTGSPYRDHDYHDQVLHQNHKP